MKSKKNIKIILLLGFIVVALLGAVLVLNSNGVKKPTFFPNNSGIADLTFFNGSFEMENNLYFITTADRVDYLTMQVLPGTVNMQVKSRNDTVLTLYDVNMNCNYSVTRDGSPTSDWARDGGNLSIDLLSGTHDYAAYAEYITPTARKS